MSKKMNWDRVRIQKDTPSYTDKLATSDSKTDTFKEYLEYEKRFGVFNLYLAASKEKKVPRELSFNEKVMRRDSKARKTKAAICRICGFKSRETLTVVKINPVLEFTMENCITLCTSCKKNMSCMDMNILSKLIEDK